MCGSLGVALAAGHAEAGLTASSRTTPFSRQSAAGPDIAGPHQAPPFVLRRPNTPEPRLRGLGIVPASLHGYGRTGVGMNAITKSRHAMALLTGAIGFYALGTVLGIIAYATFSGDSVNSFNTFKDLGHASEWLIFVGALLALAAVCTVGWETMAARVADQQIELAAAVVATLLIAIGSLIAAASDTSTSTADVLVAIGVGIWALLALSRAARLNLAAQQTPGAGSPLATIWLLAAAGLLLFAVSEGFDVGPTDQGLGIAVGILEAVGFALLAWSLVSSRNRGLMASVPTGFVVWALAALVLAGLADAIVAGLVFTPHGTLKGLRIGISISYFIRLLGLVALGWAAWRRLGELVTGRPAVSAAGRSGWSWTRLTGQGAPVPDPTRPFPAQPTTPPPPYPGGPTPTPPGPAPTRPLPTQPAPPAGAPGLEAEPRPAEGFTPPVGEPPPPPGDVPPE